MMHLFILKADAGPLLQTRGSQGTPGVRVCGFVDLLQDERGQKSDRQADRQAGRYIINGTVWTLHHALPHSQMQQ